MLQKIFVAALACAGFLTSSSQVASAAVDTVTASSTADDQEKKPSLTITGSADTYYKYDFAKTKANTFTSFTGSQNSFALGMASIKLEHTGEKTDVVLDLGFGPRAKEFSYNDNGITQAI